MAEHRSLRPGLEGLIHERRRSQVESLIARNTKAVPMKTNDFLHRNPILYDKVFEQSAAKICLDACTRHSARAPSSLLDIGCGTGRDLNLLSKHITRCVGIDYVDAMVEYAQQSYPTLRFEVGDMRSLDLNEQFDFVVSLGSGINYMISNEELTVAIANFRRHCNRGSLLLIEPLSSTAFVGESTPPKVFEVEFEGGRARGEATYEWLALQQLIFRRRRWTFSDGRDPVDDSFRLRLLMSQELRFFLENGGFRVAEIFEAKRSKIYPASMFVAAIAV